MSEHSVFQSVAGSIHSFWDRFGSDIETLMVYAVGILVYGLVVNAFYQVISKRVMFAGKQVDGRMRVAGPGRGFLYLAMFPLVSFLFFVLLTAALLFLSGREQDTRLVFTLAMAIVAAVRMAAYFSEATAHDVAKVLPLGLLGVFLVRAEVLDLVSSLHQLLELFDHLEVVVVYFIIVVALEYILRTFYISIISFKDAKKQARRQ